MSEELEKEVAVPANENGDEFNDNRSLFASGLDVLATISALGGIIGAISVDGAFPTVLCVVGGIYSAVWWHFAAIVVDACHKYLTRN